MGQIFQYNKRRQLNFISTWEVAFEIKKGYDRA
jgi:hypothetical protein